MTASGFLVFSRCVGFVWRAPGFSHPAVPAMVRIGLGLAFAVILAPTSRSVHSFDGIAFAVAVAFDFVIGAAMGTAASVLYDGAYAGGRMLDDYVGIRGSVPGAQFFAASGFGRVASLAVTAGLFLLGGYRIVIAALANSFDTLPAGAMVATHTAYTCAVLLPSAISQAAFEVAAPAVAGVFIAQIALAALARVIPRFAAFTLSFPIIFAVALVAMLLVIPVLFRAGAAPWFRLNTSGAH